MTQITVSDELARAFADASSPILLVDSNGRSLGQFTPAANVAEVPPGMTLEYEKELHRRMNTSGEFRTLDEIKKRLGWPA